MTFLASIDGHLLKEMVIDGAAMLEKGKASIDALNVFPVPDGDTGTNMSLTIMSAVKELMGVDTQDASEVAACVARGALKGARGNSGVILSQLFRGFSKGLDGAKSIDAKVFASALKSSVEVAYKAVMKPKEGTILTVARAMADSAAAMAQKNADLYGMIEGVLASGDEMLRKTPELLPVLKQAGVVDAGGAGLMAIFLGYKMAIDGEEVQDVKDLTQRIAALVSTAAPALPAAGLEGGESIEFGYCSETFITPILSGVTADHVQKLRDKLSKIGDCVLVVGEPEDGLIKVHAHSNNPGRVLQYCMQLGELSNIKVDNMREQHRTIIAEAEQLAPARPAMVKDTGFVAVAAGDGLEALFKDLTVDEVVKGGQTMNPSAEDIVQAVIRTRARNVFVLPNNKNIILAAQQAAQLLDDRKIYVVPTATVPQGVAAMIAYVPDEGIEGNLERMEQAAKGIHTGSVTYAVRDSTFDGKAIGKDDILGLDEGKVTQVGHDVQEVALALFDSMVKPEDELITLFYGQDVTQEQAEQLRAKITERFPHCDLEMLSGGQPLYYYLFSVE